MHEPKVVFLHNDFKVYWRGRLYYLKNFLANQGISIHVMEIFGQASAYSFDKVTSSENWWECLFPNEKISELKVNTIRERIHNRLDEIKPDYLICGAMAFTSGAIGLQWAKRNKKKIMIFDDAKHSFYKRNILIKFVKRILTTQADAFLVPSKDYDEEYLNWGVDKRNLYYGLSCINNNFYNKKSKSHLKSCKTIVCVARLVPIKNLNGLLHAWQNVEKRISNYRLVIVGDGPEYSPLLQLAKELFLSSVQFLGPLNSRSISKIFSESDAFILPSFYEGWGFVVNEAMASGLPVLLSNRVNAGSTLLIEGNNGYSFNPNRIDEITATILKFINVSPDKKLEMSKSAKLTIRKYDYKFLANEILRAISDFNGKPNKESNLLIRKGIDCWNGKFVTSNWDVLK
jgi:glycosyltransferase involved in cell wall biosynthesis